MKNKGFFSFESALAFLLLLFIVLALPVHSNLHASSLLESQKASDLLIIWARQDTPISEMRIQASLFLGESAEVYVLDSMPVDSGCCKRYYSILRFRNNAAEKVWLVLS